MKVIKKVLIILILLLGLVYKPNNYTIKNYKENKKQEINLDSLTSKVIVDLSIFKSDKEERFISGVVFKLKSYNNVFEFTSTENTQEELYRIEGDEQLSTTDFNKSLSPSQKEFIESIKTVNDIHSKINDYGSFEYINNSGVTNQYYIFYIPTSFLLEEVSAPTGYIKEKVYVNGGIELIYKQDVNSDNVELFMETLYVESSGTYLKYDKYEEEYLAGADLDKFVDYWEEHSIKSTRCSAITEQPICFNCGNDFLYQNHEFSKQYQKKYNKSNEEGQSEQNSYGNLFCSVTLTNVKGNISLSIDNKVNETYSVTTTSNTKLTYTVTLKNTGEFDAVDSLLTSRIPTGFEYVEGSASDGGEYNNGEVQWRVARLDAGKEKTFTFNVYVPKGTNISKDYIGESSVSNFAMQNRVDSEKTVVKLLLVNPNTSFPIMIIGGILILLSLLVPLFINYYKKSKEENKLYNNF